LFLRLAYTCLDLWADLTTGREFIDSPAAQLGTVLEAYMLDAEQRELGDGARIIKPPAMKHRSESWLQGHPDGLLCRGMLPGFSLDDVVAALRVLHDAGELATVCDEGWEGKTSGWMAHPGAWRIFHAQWGEEGTNQVPPHHRIQCDGYMAITGAKRWRLSALVPGRGLLRYVIERDDEHLSHLIEVGREWYARHVIGGEMPTPTAADVDRLNRIYAETDGSTIEAEGELMILVEEYAEARRAAKAAEIERERLAATIKARMGAAEKLKHPEGVVTWKPQEGNLYVPAPVLRESHPEVWEALAVRQAPKRPLNVYGDLFK